MIKFNSTDLEEIATSAIKHEIQKYPESLRAIISENDKTPMWDGQIMIYNNFKKRNQDWEYKLDVQIKGRQVEKFSSGNIKYPIDIVNLKNYQKTGTGTLFFVVEIIDATNTKIYYKNLLPIDIKEILDSIKNKQKTVSVLFKPIVEKSSASIKNICINFAKNSKFQQGKIIKNIEELNDIEKIKIPFFPFIKKNEKFLPDKSQDIYTYAISENGIEYILPKLKDIYAFNQTKVEIKIDDQKYYDFVTSFENSEDGYILLGKSLKIFLKGKINYKLSGNLYERINDVCFFINLIEKEYFCINNNKIDVKMDKNISSQDVLKKLRNDLKSLQELKELFDKYNIHFDINFSKLTEKDWNNISYFKNINLGKQLKPDIPIKVYSIKIAKYTISFLIIQRNNGFDTYNLFSDLSKIIKTYYIDSNKKEIIVSPYLILKEKDFLEVSNLNIDVIKNSILQFKSPMIYDNIRLMMLELLKAYDKDNNRKDLLEFAEFINELLIKEDTNVDLNLINKYQIVKRKRELVEEEIETLYKIKESNIKEEIQAGVAILLENKSDFNRYFKKLNKTAQKEFKEYPIYNLL